MSADKAEPLQKNQSTFSKNNPQNQPQVITEPTLKNISSELAFFKNNKSLPSSPKKTYKDIKSTLNPGKFPFEYAHVGMRKTLPQWNNSVAVLRNTSHMFSVSKAERFPDPKIAYYNHYQIQYPSSLSNRKAAFGFGNKAPIPQVFKAHRGDATKQVPFYEVDDMILRRNKSQTFKKGKTFGQPWSSFKSVRAPHRATVHISQQVKANPGPMYKSHDPAGQFTQKNQIHGRLRMFSEERAYHKRHEPGPQNYLINESQTKQGSLKTNFGKGSKSDFTKNSEFAKVPGPIYNISGFCDKFNNTKHKNTSRKTLQRVN